MHLSISAVSPFPLSLLIFFGFLLELYCSWLLLFFGCSVWKVYIGILNLRRTNQICSLRTNKFQMAYKVSRIGLSFLEAGVALFYHLYLNLLACFKLNWGKGFSCLNKMKRQGHSVCNTHGGRQWEGLTVEIENYITEILDRRSDSHKTRMGNWGWYI